MWTTKKTFLILFLASVCLHLSCVNDIDSLIEQAKFALDRCVPSITSTLPNCTTAAQKTDEVLATDPTNLEAAVLESSAHLGLAGFDFLQLASRLTDLQNNATNDFTEFRSLVTDVETENGREIDLDEMTAAQTSLAAALVGVTASDENERSFFQLGIIQGVDAFIRPVKVAGGGAVNVGDINASVNTIVSDDFVASDTHLVASGTTKDDILRPIRENFCRCSLNGGFTAACLRDLMRCELSDTAVPEQDYDGDGGAARADCTTLLSPAGLDACGGTDTSS